MRSGSCCYRFAGRAVAMKYAFWNNKGGVGKTFLCFAVASEYARTHPRANVVVIDVCPQANVSEILLGGNRGGGVVLHDLLGRRPTARTIGGYYHQRILQPHGLTGTETDFRLYAAMGGLWPRIRLVGVLYHVTPCCSKSRSR